MSVTGPEFALLGGFAVLKIALGLTLIYFGLRGGARGEPDEPFDAPEPELPPVAPERRTVSRRRAERRGGPRTAVATRRSRRIRV